MEDKKTKIYDCGKEIFSNKGFKDTNVSDITKKAGIAIGTFTIIILLRKSFLWISFLKKMRNSKKLYGIP